MNTHLTMEDISKKTYVRERLEPIPGDKLYLHLSDLRIIMGQVSSQHPLKVLDFGCGGSPYRDLFPNADYKRADLEGVPDIDYTIRTGGGILIEEADQVFDLVLSSQVLEHVPSPKDYLVECRRLLKVGGTLVVTTHGFYEDHGCPFDYWRWTSDGLALELKNAGFEVERVWKMTVGPRAVWFLMQQSKLIAKRGSLLWFFLAPWRLAMRHARPLLDRHCDRVWAAERVVIDGGADRNMYIGVAVQARKV